MTISQKSAPLTFLMVAMYKPYAIISQQMFDAEVRNLYTKFYRSHHL